MGVEHQLEQAGIWVMQRKRSRRWKEMITHDVYSIYLKKMTSHFVPESDGLSLVTRNGVVRLSGTSDPWL